MANYEVLVQTLTSGNPTIAATAQSHYSVPKKWISWKQTGRFDNQGNLQEVLSIGRDVQHVYEIRKEKDQRLLAAFRKAVDTNIICTITNAAGIITYANDKFCEISKYSKEELIGKTHTFVNSGHHPKEFFAEMWRTIRSGKAWTGQIKNRAKDGTSYWVESVIMPIKDENDKINGYLSLRILIDEQKKLEEEKNAYMKSLEAMLFMVSHEIRKPITTCEGLLQLMQEGLVSGDEYQQAVDHLLVSAKELDNYSRKLNTLIEKNISPKKPA